MDRLRNILINIGITVVGGLIVLMLWNYLNFEEAYLRPSVTGLAQEITIDDEVISGIVAMAVDGQAPTSSITVSDDPSAEIARSILQVVGEGTFRDSSVDKVELRNTSHEKSAEIFIELFDLPYLDAISNLGSRRIGSTNANWTYRMAPEEEIEVYIFGVENYRGRYTITSETHSVDVYRMTSIEDSFGRSPFLPDWSIIMLCSIFSIALYSFLLEVTRPLFISPTKESKEENSSNDDSV